MREVVTIFLATQSKKRDVIAFLEELRSILDRDGFDIGRDIILISRSKTADMEHSTPYTLLALDYDISDVAARLRELTVEEYSETKLDKDDTNPILLYVFGKVIAGRLVYIKLKIKGDMNRYILCVSFHFAKQKMKFPYAG